MSDPKIKPRTNPLKRGDSEHYRQLQERSMAARINRIFPVQFKLLPGAKVPFRKRPTDAAFDISAYENAIITPHGMTMVRTGTMICCPAGYWFYLAGRSSINREGVVIPPNVIDAGYTGEVMVALFNTTSTNFVVEAGDRIAQAVFAPILHPQFEQVEEFTLDPDARGQAGFGSSGRKSAH